MLAEGRLQVVQALLQRLNRFVVSVRVDVGACQIDQAEAVKRMFLAKMALSRLRALERKLDRFLMIAANPYDRSKRFGRSRKGCRVRWISLLDNDDRPFASRFGFRQVPFLQL